MNAFHLMLAAGSVLVLALALVSRPLARSPLVAPLVALAAGVLLGPHVAGVMTPGSWPIDTAAFFEEATRITLAVGLVGVALRAPPRALREHVRTLAPLLGLGMPLMWLAAAGCAHWTLGAGWPLALLAGAAASPTDPIVAGSLLSGRFSERRLPARLREVLSLESGLNDGLAFPFVLFAATLMSSEHGLGEWLLNDVLWGVLGGALLGAALGALAGELMARARRHEHMQSPSVLVYSIALSLFVVALGTLAGANEVLAAFVAGAAFARRIGEELLGQLREVQDALNALVTTPVFLLLGALLPWSAWGELGWSALAFVAAVLALRRLPALLLLRPLLPALRARKDILFAGWFGPIGVGALYYAELAQRELGDPAVWNVVTLLVVGSLLAHGLSAATLTRRYAAATGQLGGPSARAGRA